uniref:Ring finger protein 170 n=1 Tax=Cyprinus carpio TaxID=7962 RepID=A0A8C1VFT5_CYPCA
FIFICVCVQSLQCVCDSLIEGVSDPVLIGLATLALRNEQQRIHPESQEQVCVVREQLQSEQVSDAVCVFRRDVWCPVCLQQAVLPVETNCGHLFCVCVCLLTVGQVTLLLGQRSDAGRTGRTRADPQRHPRFSGQPRSLLDVPTLLRHASERCSPSGGSSGCSASGSLLDFIPEGVVGLLGFMDNFFVILLLFISIMYREVVTQRLAA